MSRARGPRVDLVVAADEVLSGRTREGNGAWLALRLAEEGASLGALEVVADDVDAIAGAVERAAGRADLVVVSGGLGPTEDDRTRHALARVLGVPLAERPEAWAMVERAVVARGRPPLSAHRRQALLPEGATPLENPEGVAPGIAAEVGGRPVLALPGVPHEFRALVESAVLPRLRERGGLLRVVVRSVWTAGATEAEIAAAVGDLMRAEDPSVGSYPEDGEVELRVTARGEGAERRADEVAGEMRRRLGAAAVGPERLAPAVVALLSRGRRTLAVAESVTGGLVAGRLTDVPGASAVLRGGWVAYTDDFKRDVLGVPRALLESHGAVSDEVARAMAEGARERAAADAGLATTGSAGPSPWAGPRGAVPVGTAFVAATLAGGPTRSLRIEVPGASRDVVRRRATVAALDLLRRLLQGA